MAQSKQTKKFEAKHLKGTLKRRNEVAKIKQRNRLKDQKKARRAAEQGSDDEPTAESKAEETSAGRQKGEVRLEDMTVDEFFAGGFDVARSMGEEAGQKRSGKRKRITSGADAEDASVASVEDHAAAAGSDEDVEDNDMKLHQEELQALAKKDPEFYAYLKENDAELLEFAEDQGVDGGDPDGSGEATHGKDGKRKSKKDQSNDVSMQLVKRWASAMSEKQSLRAMRETVLAFRAAAHLNDQDDKTYKYTIKDAEVYHELLLCALRDVPLVLNHHIPVKQSMSGKINVATDNVRFRALTALLQSHTGAMLHLLDNLSDAGTTRTALSSLLSLVPYLLSFKKLCRSLSRSVVDIWAYPAHEEATRISAFLILQSLVKNGDAGIKELVLRTTYQGLLKGCRNTNIHTLSAINLMKNSALDLWGPPSTGGKDALSVPYTTAFTFIRSLAIHLRSSIKHNANEAYKNVYNWQYVHALDFWSRVLSVHCASLAEATAGRESNLRPLIYPLVQVTLGALRLIPTPAYFPLRFHCTRSLLRLSAATNTFIPLAASLYEVLTSTEMRKPSKPSTLKPLDFEVSIRAPKSYLRTRVYQDGVGEQVTDLMAEFFAIWCKNIAFPELTLPVCVMLKRWLKQVSPYNPNAGRTNGAGSHKKGKGGQENANKGGNRNGKLNSSVSLLIQKLDANARFVEEKRAKVDFAPNDRAGVEAFLKETDWTKMPLGAFVQGQRRQREERKKVLEEARRQENAKRDRGENASDDDEDSEGEDDEMEEELGIGDDDEDEIVFDDE